MGLGNGNNVAYITYIIITTSEGRLILGEALDLE